jgi:DNA-binding FadR family transcriptional regulator
VELRRIKGESLNATAQEEIKLFIVESGLKGGDPIPTEKVLEEKLGISRTSIREALRSLEALGIIETRHGVGRFLREFNYDAILANLSYNISVNVQNFREIIEIRIALETNFLEQVTPTMTDEVLSELSEIVDRMEEEVYHGEPDEGLIQTHTDFHLKLYESADNQLLLHLIRMFATIQRTLTMLKQYRTSDTGEFVQLHRRLVEALAERDPVLAKERLLEHFKDVIAWSKEHRMLE